MPKILIQALPDIHNFQQLPKEYDNYGRFGETNRGNFYTCGIHTQHANNTKIGGYWAVNKEKDTLYVSPRGNKLEFEEFVQKIIDTGKIREIYKMAGLKDTRPINEMANEQRFSKIVGPRAAFMVLGLGNAVDKQKQDQAIAAMQAGLQQMGYAIQVQSAGRFGFDPSAGWLFDDSMMSAGHPNSWIPGSRGYFAITNKSVLFFPKNEMQFTQDSLSPQPGQPQQKITFLQDLAQVLRKPIKLLREASNKMKDNYTFDTYMEIVQKGKKCQNFRRPRKIR